MAESRQRWQVLRRWHDHSPWRLLRTVLLAVLPALAGLVVLSLSGLAGLTATAGIVLVGALIVWAVVMPGRLAPPVPPETLAEITDPRARLEVIDARTRLHHDPRNGALQLLTVLAVLVGAGLGFQQLAEDRDQAMLLSYPVKGSCTGTPGEGRRAAGGYLPDWRRIQSFMDSPSEGCWSAR